MKDTMDIFNDAMELSPSERAKLVNELLSSLNKPDEKIDQAWQDEVKSRIKAAEEGEIISVPFDEILSKYKK